MGWIYQAQELEKAIIDVTSRQVSKKVALAEIIEAYEGGGISNVYNLANSYGIHPIFNTDGTFAFFSTNELSTSVTSSVPSLYAETLEVDVVESTAETVVSKTLPAVVEKGIERGAVSTLAKVAPVVGAIATGIGLGVKAYKEEPALWNDISSSIFSGDLKGLVSVVARKQAGNYISYVSEDDMARVVQKFADTKVFDVYEIESTIDKSFTGGTIPVTFSSVGVPSTRSGALAYERLKEVYPNNTIIGYNITGTEIYEATSLLTIDLAQAPTTAYVRGWSEPHYPVTGVPWLDMNVQAVSCTIVRATGQVYQYNVGEAYNTIASGTYQEDTYGNKLVGGLNVNVISQKGDNKLFYIPTQSSNTLNGIAPNSSLDSIKSKLREKFPNWYSNSFDMTKIDPSTGNNVSDTMLPLAIPNTDPYENPIGDPDEKQEPTQEGKIDPDADPNPLTEELPEIIPDTEIPIPTPIPTPPDPSGGEVTGGGAKGLWAVYNPTVSEIKSLGSYLWSSNIIDILQKFLNNPMDCIISLHMIYATPSIGDKKNIILGYLDSGVSSHIVTNQFIDIDCGTVNVNEYYGDARDYTNTYTQIECYLPFVGIVKFKTEDIVNGSVNIVYTIDVLTGALLCKVFVTKLGSKQQLYTYSGNCSVQIPLTGSDRTRLLSGAISGASTGAVIGGVAGAVVGGAVGGFFGGSSIDKSGSFTANSGALGIKKPYLIITRKYSYDASNYNEFYGYPSNVTLTLSSCKGYTKVKSVHVDGISEATESEKNEIETLLMNGIIIN